MRLPVGKTFLRAALVLAASWGWTAEEAVLSPAVRFIPGEIPTPYLRYSNPTARTVVVAGSWDAWSGRWAHAFMDGPVWVFDVRRWRLPFGLHEFKFIVNGDWEPGANRVFYANEQGLLERPSEWILAAQLANPTQVNVYLRWPLETVRVERIRLIPPVPVQSWVAKPSSQTASQQGYAIASGWVTFLFDEKAYGVFLGPTDRVMVAGNFNGWDSSGGREGVWMLKRKSPRSREWELTVALSDLRRPPNEPAILFKFVVNRTRWLPPPASAINAVPDGRGNVNLLLDPRRPAVTELSIGTGEPLHPYVNWGVVIEGLAERPVWALVDVLPMVDQMVSEKPLGVTLDREQGATTYRIFAPRATDVYLCLYNTPEHEIRRPTYKKLQPAERYRLWRDERDGVWEISLLGLDIGKYYSFNIVGPTGNGEGFDPFAQVGDPYARAAAHGRNNCIVIDPDATNRWFGGWTDHGFIRVPKQDVIIYEAHVRALTIHPSSGVPPQLRGKYEGLIASLGTGTGLDHLKDLGVTHIELLPTIEFNGSETEYNWGYGPVLYFAPEASYARDPLRGSQYYEFKRLVNELHKAGFGVILDVVYNHVGSPNFFHHIDKKYYFRLTPDFNYMNFSGCGNDLRTEAPMLRRMIVENILYWIREFHVDGFRFDLAELIDIETLMAVRDAVYAVDTNILLISEPWSARGDHKWQLKGTGWSAWNNDFRYAAKDFVSGQRNRDWLKKVIQGSVDLWAAQPIQPINYLESHDDMALADEFCTRPDRDGRYLQPTDVAMNRLAATILFTSLGIPMLHEGQEFLRSKRGFANTYNLGDGVNAINWNDRYRPLAKQTWDYYKGLIALRKSTDGAAFRVGSRPPHDYYKWLEPPNPLALGYIVNVPHVHEGAGFVVLLNASADPVEFVFRLPEGNWRQVCDGERVVLEGLPDARILRGPADVRIRVSPISAYIFQDGF